jgi:proline dehydrogenase
MGEAMKNQLLCIITDTLNQLILLQHMNQKVKIPFENTEIAFKHVSDRDLMRARWLFKMFNYKWLIQYGPPLATFSLKLGLPVKGLIRKTIFNHFCGGEAIDDCDRTVQVLAKNGVGAILDFSVEGVQEEKNFDSNFHEILNSIEKAGGAGAYPFAVFKPTGIGRFSLYEKVNSGAMLNEKEKAEFERIKKRFSDLCLAAAKKSLPLFVDAEESWIQDCLDQLAEEQMEIHNREEVIVFNTVQLYRKGRLEYMDRLYAKAKDKGFKVGLKLVRGAYMEKERARAKEMKYSSPIQDNKADCDRDFNEAVRKCFSELTITKVCIATHNQDSCALMANLMEEAGIAHQDDRIWFAQLFGMSDHISFNLAEMGYKVAKYLPYGPVAAVLPYLSRRAKENSAVAGQAGREMQLIDAEILRRKSAS